MATIIFDLDDTLYDTQKLKKDISEVFRKHLISEEDINSSYLIARKDLNYNFTKHIEILNVSYPNLKREIILEELNNLFLNDYLIENTQNLLKNLKIGNKIILLTNGVDFMQRKKIESSNIENYFDEIHIIQNPKHEYLQNFNFEKEVYFINDKESENQEIKKLFPHFTIIQKKIGEPLSTLPIL